MSKRLQINCRSNPYIEALIASMMEKQEIKKTEVIHRAIEYYAYHVLEQDEIMNIRLYQQYES